MSITITANQNTLLKKKPIQSASLSDNEFMSVPKGKPYVVQELLPVKFFKDDRDLTCQHSYLRLAEKQGDWYVFDGHWDGLIIPPFISPPSNSLVTKQQAEAVYGRPITTSQLNDLNACLVKFEINTHPRIRHFLSQTAHESGGLQWLKELASGSAYESRRDLGNTQAGDGKRFKGGGVIQLTGRANYQAFCNYMNDSKIMQGVDYVALTYPFSSAGFWWKNNSMNALCDRGATVKEITRRVNGGVNGLSDRERYYQKTLKVFL